MHFEIHHPDLERRVLDGIHTGRFRDMDELLTKALDVLEGPVNNGLGMFASPEDVALLDSVVAIAYEERHRPAKAASIL